MACTSAKRASSSSKKSTQNNNLKKGLKWLGGGFLGSLTALLILLSIK